MSASEEELEHVKESLFQGRKIEAIKLYRARTGAGLAESKTAIEKLEAELRLASPERFKAPAGRMGCSSAMLAACVFTVLFIVWLTVQ